MNYEKKYNTALERARELSKTVTGANYEYIFPELKESEDERVRKEIISILKGETVYTSKEDTDKYVDWLEKQGEQKQTWQPNAAQLIVIKDLIEDKNTSKVNKVILRGILDEFTNNHKRDIDDAYLQGICDAKHEIEKHGEQTQLDYEHADIPQKDFAPKVEPKFKVGDKVVAKSYKTDVKTIEKVSQYGTYWTSSKGYHSGWWSEDELEPYVEHKILNADEVIEWLECKAFQGWAEEINIKQIVDKFKKDFGL